MPPLCCYFLTLRKLKTTLLSISLYKMGRKQAIIFLRIESPERERLKRNPQTSYLP